VTIFPQDLQARGLTDLSALLVTQLGKPLGKNGIVRNCSRFCIFYMQGFPKIRGNGKLLSKILQHACVFTRVFSSSIIQGTLGKIFT